MGASLCRWVSNRGVSIPVGTRFCSAKSNVLYLCFRLTLFCVMQSPRFTASKPSKFAFTSDEKSIRQPTTSFVRCYLNQQLRRRVDISEKIKPHEWEKLPWRWIVERTFTWMNAARRVRHSSACIYQDGGCSSEIFVAILPGKEPVVGT